MVIDYITQREFPPMPTSNSASETGCENSNGQARGCAAPIDNPLFIGLMLIIAVFIINKYKKLLV